MIQVLAKGGLKRGHLVPVPFNQGSPFAPGIAVPMEVGKETARGTRRHRRIRPNQLAKMATGHPRSVGVPRSKGRRAVVPLYVESRFAQFIFQIGRRPIPRMTTMAVTASVRESPRTVHLANGDPSRESDSASDMLVKMLMVRRY